MNKKESFEINEKFYNTYCGIIFNNALFQAGSDYQVTYEFDCLQFGILRDKYSLFQIAGKGDDFQRALRLLKWLHPRLAHKGDYDNHIACNALSLLEYSLEKADCGINCLNKAKILEECCLSLGIYARRVGLYPCSPYDMDNHIVTEIYDRSSQKWIMLDPTSGGYFTDGKQPLSCIEIRNGFAQRKPLSIVLPRQGMKDVEKLFQKNIEWNAYYAKNFYVITVDLYAGFGEKSGTACLVPQGVALDKWFVQNQRYKVDWAKAEGLGHELIALLEKQLDGVKGFVPQIGNSALWEQP